MAGNRRRTLELVYSNDGPVGVVEPGKADGASGSRDSAEDAQAIERFLAYLYEELRTLDKNQPAHLVGAAILALREDADGNESSRP
ncbi:hypothetical protein CKO28_07630 [Rhodovibrio sodomensis]|uniref:Anti-sigma factor NepR domain-containing protein n=1 Tax=Rhodovibrio sodomensis TaxID=1088 RepID=A0ABS1DCF8_9PROT|nr:hypothetical protein [Rhodovibrio sodomensis]MBK1667904.1 hypothetical protein [Rhodovibrio sodomensis]